MNDYRTITLAMNGFDYGKIQFIKKSFCLKYIRIIQFLINNKITLDELYKHAIEYKQTFPEPHNTWENIEWFTDRELNFN